MTGPPLPTPPPGRSALPLLLPVEAELRARHDRAVEEAERRVREAEAEAARIRHEGEERLGKVVAEAEAQALREAEDQARDRVSEVRARIQRWLEPAEEAARGALDEALDICCRE